MRPGRKPAGPKLVEGLPGSDFAKRRLEQILRTVSGEVTIEEACTELGISRTRFYDLRQSLLEGMVEHLEPRPAGRRPEQPEVPEDVTFLKRKVAQLELELKATEVRAELNMFLPLYERKRSKKKDR